VSTITVAVDAMGGDQAPGAVVAGAIQAARRGIPIKLTGPSAILLASIEEQGGADVLDLTVVDAPETVSMDESPLTAHRRKRGSSVRVAAALVGSGQAQALFSAGHTGATYLAARAEFGVISGVERPALAARVILTTGDAVDNAAPGSVLASHPFVLQKPFELVTLKTMVEQVRVAALRDMVAT